MLRTMVSGFVFFPCIRDIKAERSSGVMMSTTISPNQND
jgi:hypothetical protein